ncbi:hypothetical protein N7451_006845 [Penicillium sp. IBT 35674x]|nr:hypothetical protein N7451_006845 [Penicillium sp. IBT 35674x]
MQELRIQDSGFQGIKCRGLIGVKLRATSTLSNANRKQKNNNIQQLGFACVRLSGREALFSTPYGRMYLGMYWIEIYQADK